MPKALERVNSVCIECVARVMIPQIQDPIAPMWVGSVMAAKQVPSRTQRMGSWVSYFLA